MSTCKCRVQVRIHPSIHVTTAVCKGSWEKFFEIEAKCLEMRFCLACQVVVSGNLNGASDSALTKRNALWDVAFSLRQCIQHGLWVWELSHLPFPDSTSDIEFLKRGNKCRSRNEMKDVKRCTRRI